MRASHETKTIEEYSVGKWRRLSGVPSQHGITVMTISGCFETCLYQRQWIRSSIIVPQMKRLQKFCFTVYLRLIIIRNCGSSEWPRMMRSSGWNSIGSDWSSNTHELPDHIEHWIATIDQSQRENETWLFSDL